MVNASPSCNQTFKIQVSLRFNITQPKKILDNVIQA